jgi:hypothetical protein
MSRTEFLQHTSTSINHNSWTIDCMRVRGYPLERWETPPYIYYNSRSESCHNSTSLVFFEKCCFKVLLANLNIITCHDASEAYGYVCFYRCGWRVDPEILFIVLKSSLHHGINSPERMHIPSSFNRYIPMSIALTYPWIFLCDQAFNWFLKQNFPGWLIHVYAKLRMQIVSPTLWTCIRREIVGSLALNPIKLPLIWYLVDLPLWVSRSYDFSCVVYSSSIH